MSEVYKIILTSLSTILGGIIIFTVSQIVMKFVIEPLHEQSKLIGEIAYSLIYHANAGTGLAQHYTQQIQNITKAEELDETQRKHLVEQYQGLIIKERERWEEASRTLRQQASQLLGRTHAVPLYRVWRIFGRPSYDDVVIASSRLIGLANSGSKSDIKRITEIAKRLRIEIILKHMGSD